MKSITCVHKRPTSNIQLCIVDSFFLWHPRVKKKNCEPFRYKLFSSLCFSYASSISGSVEKKFYKSLCSATLGLQKSGPQPNVTSQIMSPSVVPSFLCNKCLSVLISCPVSVIGKASLEFHLLCSALRVTTQSHSLLAECRVMFKHHAVHVDVLPVLTQKLAIQA